MSPEIVLVTKKLLPVNHDGVMILTQTSQLIADLPDKDGIFHTAWGQVAMAFSLNPEVEIQRMMLRVNSLGRAREIHLSDQGTGGTRVSLAEHLIVKLHEPIRRRGEWRKRVFFQEEILPSPVPYRSGEADTFRGKVVVWERKRG